MSYFIEFGNYFLDIGNNSCLMVKIKLNIILIFIENAFNWMLTI